MLRQFTIKGWLYEHITLTWKEGELFSDCPEVLEVIKKRIEELEELKAFIFCPETKRFFTENYLKKPYSAYLVLKHVLEEVYELPDKEEVLRLEDQPSSSTPLLSS
ncbi:hypothetical protein [Thermoactinomyces sp. CICC 23799]|jgi:hypothetical protein|uniref:hypothetical protein n=1 Tax=Thermoactinomyces sp. CICC 23799 TaxID=2767429 RepID=UPI0018DE0194|nr:hypothetical protein [Thermoactinomyces sp. CICC 23799]MBH8600862.1 hypothetical protein [Thermoactinomyces sp. CICC 23799]